jgi:hypothetical protein
LEDALTKLRTLRLHASTLALCLVVFRCSRGPRTRKREPPRSSVKSRIRRSKVIPGAAVTATHVATGASKATVSDERGSFRLSNMQPGLYTLKVELSGFKTAVVDRVSLQVDSVSRETVILEVGGVAETISVVSETSHLNTTDASVGNVMSREQIRSLPVEAQNVVHLLSLQPGAIFIPTSNPATVDPRMDRWAARAPISKASRSTASTSTIRRMPPPTPRRSA